MNTNRCIHVPALICALILLCAPAWTASTPTELNVKDFGAVGDGRTDDSAAILKAVAEGKAKQLPVHFPRGHYLITKPITLDNQSIKSNEPGAWPADTAPMPILFIKHTAGPAVTAKEGSSIHGLMFDYDDSKAEKHPPTIQLSGGGICISNVLIRYAYDGIMSDGKSNCGRLNIENVFIVSPRNCGVYVALTLDLPTLRNIEVWNNLNRPNVTAFRFGRNDGLRGSQLIAFQVHTAFELVDDPNGGCWGTFVDCGTDACVHGWRAEGQTGHTVGVTGGYWWNHYQSFVLNNPKVCMRVANAEIQSNGGPVIDAKAAHHLLLTGCRIGRAVENATDPFLNLQAVRSFTMNGCITSDFGPVFSLGRDLKQAAIDGNVFEQSKYARILKDERNKDADIIFSDNSGMELLPSTDASGKAR